MKTGRLAVAALALWCVTLVVVGVVFYRAHRATHAAADPRAVVALSGPTRDSVLAEMRGMLVAVNQILGAAARGDSAEMRTAAATAGLADTLATLGPDLPEEFRRWAAGTHARFDSLAADIAAGAPRDTVTTRLARLTAGCTACHVAYRLSPR
jgi:hypothetical protein